MKIEWSLLCKYLSPVYSSMLCVQCLGAMVLEKAITIFICCQCVFRHFVIFSPLKKPGPFIWTNLNSVYPRMIYGSLVEIGPFVLEKTILKFVLFRYYIPLESGGAPQLNKLELPSKRMIFFVPSLIEISSVVLEKNISNFTIATTKTTDNGQISIRKAHVSLS